MKSMLLFWRYLYCFQMLMYSGSSERFKTNFTQHLLHLGRFPLYRLIMCVFLPSKATRGPLELLRQCYHNYEGVRNKFQCISRSTFKLSNLVSKSYHDLLVGRAGSEVSDWPCSHYLLSPTVFPCRQATKRVLYYRWVWKVSFAMEFCTKKPLWDGCCI